MLLDLKKNTITKGLSWAIICYLFLLLVVSACNGGNASGNNNYATFEIIDQQTANGSATETVLTALSTQQYNAYNPMLGFQVESGNTLSLGANDSLSVSISGASSVNLTSLALGFYNYLNPNSVNYANSMNLNTYDFLLTYNNHSIITTMMTFPRIYIPLSGTCTTVANAATGVNDTNCTISNTNTKIPYSIGTITYKLTGTLTDNCLGTVTGSSINQDTVSFQNCQIFNNPQIQLQIASDVPLSNSSGDSFNIRGQYYFLSPLVTVVKQ